MTNRDKMLNHISKAEEWDLRVKFLEGEADRRAVKKVTDDGRGQNSEYVAATLLADNFWYKQAVGKRNSHRSQATMYGIAALVDEIRFRPPVVDK